jgi:hypothetical protein
VATKQVKLMDIALARSGDKGNGSNVGVIARSPEIYAYLDKELTAAKVADHFSEIALGGVRRYGDTYYRRPRQSAWACTSAYGGTD